MTTVNISMDWRGRKPEALKQQISSALDRGVMAALHVIEDTAVERTPYLTGDLQGSVKTAVESSDNKAEGVISYDTVYAARQHEEVTWNHPRKGQAKYLSSAASDRQGDAAQEMTDVIQQAIGGMF